MFDLASSYERGGQFDKAIELFRRILKILPQSAMTLNYLGYMFADKNINLQESLEMIEKAVKLEPENGAYLDSYGWILYRLGKYKEAEEQLKKALDIIKDDSLIHEHLGDAYKAQGKLQEADQQWRKALELDPNNQEIKEKLQAK
jgi:Tfp pilus assembly protein PilF